MVEYERHTKRRKLSKAEPSLEESSPISSPKDLKRLLAFEQDIDSTKQSKPQSEVWELI